MGSENIPYGKQWVCDDDVAAVVETLRSDWLTTGPRVGEFEKAFAECVGARDAVAVNSGTAALHAAMFAVGVGPGDEVIVPAMTFAASANAVVYQGATPVFADVDPETLLVDPASVASRITPRTKAVVSVDYAGQPCAYDELRALTGARSLELIADGCHALGGQYRGRPVGSLAALTTFSFHPVKHIATGEGGMVTTDDAGFATRMRRFRNHGITTDARQREAAQSFVYEMVDLGFNYRLSDIQCALGRSQLRKLPAWIERRRAIARTYDAAFAGMPAVRPLAVREHVAHAYHIYVVRLDLGRLRGSRADVFAALRNERIGVNVHYIPVHLHPYYRQRFGTGPGLCPAAEAAYEEILTLPLFPRMTDGEVQRVIEATQSVIAAFGG